MPRGAPAGTRKHRCNSATSSRSDRPMAPRSSQPPHPRAQPEPRRTPRPRRGVGRLVFGAKTVAMGFCPCAGGFCPPDPPRKRGGAVRDLERRPTGRRGALLARLGAGRRRDARLQRLLQHPARRVDRGRHPRAHRRGLAAGRRRQGSVRGRPTTSSRLPRRVVRAGPVSVQHTGDQRAARRRPRAPLSWAGSSSW